VRKIERERERERESKREIGEVLYSFDYMYRSAVRYQKKTQNVP
jgi:hypothetical protein